jgi:hypothetical protein
MASTIKLKNGSGAPTTGDLVQGEPALDLTNKRLYTENASGVVIEVGTNPSALTIGGTALTATATELNYTDGVTSNIQTQLNTKAPIASPTFTGTATIPTADINAGTIDGTVIGGSSAAAVTGTTITGTSFVSSGDMTFGDSNKAIFGAGSDLQIYHDGSHSIIADAGSGNLQIRANDFQLLNAANTQNIIRGYDATGAVSLHYGGAEKLATSSSGVYVTGTATADGGSISGNLLIGTSLSSAKLTVGTFGDTARAAQFHGGSILIDGGAASEIIIGDGNAAYMSIQTTDDATAMKIRNYSGSADLVTVERVSGNVGIGTSSPYAPLTLRGTGDQIILDLNTSTNGDYSAISWNTSTSDLGSVYGAEIRGYRAAAGAYGALAFHTRPNGEVMRIDSSGNVLVGKSSQVSAGRFGVQYDSGQHGIGIDQDFSGSGTLINFLVQNSAVGDNLRHLIRPAPQRKHHRR